MYQKKPYLCRRFQTKNHMPAVRHLLLLLAATFFVACQRGSEEPRSNTDITDLDAPTAYALALEACDADSIQRAELLLNHAIRQATQAGDLHTLYLAQLQLAQSLAWGNTEAALAMARQALATYERHPDSPRNHIIILDNIGTYASQLAYNTDTSFDQALAYALRAYDLAQESSDSLGTEQVAQTLTTLANIHWAMEHYSEALRCARRAVACAPENLLTSAQQVLARCLVSCDSLEAAERVYRAMQPGDDLRTAYVIQSSLAKLALYRRDTEAAEEAIDSAFAGAEELYYRALRQKDEYYQNTLAQEVEQERMAYHSRLQRRTLWGGIVLLLMLAAVAAYVARQRLLAARRQLASETLLRQQEQQMHQQDLHHHEQQALLQQEQLRQRDGVIDFLKDFIVQRSAVIQKLGDSAERHVTLSSREWSEVERTLDAIDADRFTRLRQRFPDLREEDIQLCILTRLRLTNRAIGNIYGVSISAVQHRKLRLKKEVFGEPDPDLPFEQVLDSL